LSNTMIRYTAADTCLFVCWLWLPWTRRRNHPPSTIVKSSCSTMTYTKSQAYWKVRHHHRDQHEWIHHDDLSVHKGTVYSTLA
jgi:hypothetical protein